MRKWLTLLGAGLAGVGAPAVFAVTISGSVTASGSPLPNVEMLAPKANCTPTNAAGNYTCTVGSGWNGALAAYANGFSFVVAGDPQRAAAVTFVNLSANQSGVNFLAAPAFGLRSEFALARPSNGKFYLDYDWNSLPNAVIGLGSPGDSGLAGDVTGDGISDLIAYRSGLWFIDTNLDGIADRTVGFGGVSGDIPLVGDTMGTGKDDLVIYRNGLWFVSGTGDGNLTAIYGFGGIPSKDVPLLADIDGDGKADLIIYRDGTWYVSTKRNGIADIVLYLGGAPGDIPTTLDYDGDGRADPAIYRSIGGAGFWYVSTNHDGLAQTVFGYGAAGDRPLAGFFNRANTRFVKAGSGCITACTQANPYGTITAAWRDAVDGDVIRIAAGNYLENLTFSYPGNQYAPGKFGKNNIKLLGVSAASVVVSPPSSDAFVLQGATGYVVRGMRFTGGAAMGRGIVAIGGPNSVLPTFPGPQLSLLRVDAIESGGTNALLTGASNVRIQNSRASRSHGGHGVSLWQETYARILDSEVIQNGYATPAGPPPPDAGKGLDVRDDSELDARRNLIRENLTFGVSGVNRSVVRLSSNTIAATGYNGVMLCGAAANDQTTSVVTGNYIAGNGTVRPDLGWNGMEIYLTCLNSHQISANTFVGNTYNGLFVGSGTATIVGNMFQANRIGVTAFAGNDSGTVSATDTALSLFGNTFDANTVDGLYAARSIGTPRTLVATVGGTAPGQANTFRNHVAPAFHALSCDNLTMAFVCPSGGNAFTNNVDDVEASCPTSCKK